MKTCLIALFLFALSGCGGAESKPAVVIPPDADLKADVMIQGGGSSRKVEISFYFSKPVAPGEKTSAEVEMIPVENAQFNGQPLTAVVNEAGRQFYTGEKLALRPENLVAITLNGKPYEGRGITQTTLDSKSVTVVMVPK